MLVYQNNETAAAAMSVPQANPVSFNPLPYVNTFFRWPRESKRSFESPNITIKKRITRHVKMINLCDVAKNAQA